MLALDAANGRSRWPAEGVVILRQFRAATHTKSISLGWRLGKSSLLNVSCVRMGRHAPCSAGLRAGCCPNWCYPNGTFAVRETSASPTSKNKRHDRKAPNDQTQLRWLIEFSPWHGPRERPHSSRLHAI